MGGDARFVAELSINKNLSACRLLISCDFGAVRTFFQFTLALHLQSFSFEHQLLLGRHALLLCKFGNGEGVTNFRINAKSALNIEQVYNFFIAMVFLACRIF